MIAISHTPAKSRSVPGIPDYQPSDDITLEPYSIRLEGGLDAFRNLDGGPSMLNALMENYIKGIQETKLRILIYVVQVAYEVKVERHDLRRITVQRESPTALYEEYYLDGDQSKFICSFLMDFTFDQENLKHRMELDYKTILPHLVPDHIINPNNGQPTTSDNPGHSADQ